VIKVFHKVARQNLRNLNTNSDGTWQMKFWYIYGAGGLGVETMDILCHMIADRSLTDLKPAFLIDGPAGDPINDHPVVSLEDAVPGSFVTIAVGEPAIRTMLREKCVDAGLELASAISPKAFVSEFAVLGRGCIMAPFCSIQARARVDENVAINTAAIVGHDVVVERDTGLSSMTNLGGGSRVGAGSYIGMGALVKESLTIGHSTIVGMGSVVYNDVPEEVVCVGNPARVSRRNTDQRVFK